ncbi:MAG: DUF1622 domain-containing protein [Candidatus Sericytochromatia bacterium]|nr:DUF1622 domain-containing protein [Candidatus Sericytochromatia bacterium]
MDVLIKQETVLLASVIEAIAGLVVILASLATAWVAVGLGRVSPAMPRPVAARLLLGRWLSLALEFELAADILRTAATPSWNEIAQLAAIIVIRTVLNFFLERDVASAERRQPAS